MPTNFIQLGTVLLLVQASIRDRNIKRGCNICLKIKKRKSSVSILLGTKEASVLVRAVRKKKKRRGQDV